MSKVFEFALVGYWQKSGQRGLTTFPNEVAARCGSMLDAISSVASEIQSTTVIVAEENEYVRLFTAEAAACEYLRELNFGDVDLLVELADMHMTRVVFLLSDRSTMMSVILRHGRAVA